tara:strand:- start:19307 stop:20515 length:1209 start_codon:yes stop_codon:yes gene_type:complete
MYVDGKDERELMQALKKQDLSKYTVERQDAQRGLSQQQYARLMEYLKNGYDCLKVVDAKGISSEISVDDLVQILETNSNVREIVIERIALNQATVHRLLLEEGNDYHEVVIPADADRILPFKDVKLKKVGPSTNQRKATKLESRLQSLITPNDELQDHNVEAKSPLEKIRENEDLITSKEVVKVKKQKEASEVHLTQVRVARNQQLSSELFFRLKNHHEAFRLGNKYVKDIEAGQTVFGFHGNDTSSSKKNSIYGLVAFMTYQRGHTVAAVLGNLYDDIKKELVTVYGEKSVEKSLFDGIPCEKIDEIYLIRREEFATMSKNQISSFKRSSTDTTTIVLVDLPPRKEAEEVMGTMLPLFKIIDSFTFVLEMAKASISQVRSDLHFMHCYGFSIKGFIFKEDR